MQREASLLCHLHFWTLRALSPRTATGSDIATHKYHEKLAGGESKTDAWRREWAEGRGITWTPRNKKPDKFRDTLRTFEEMLNAHQIVCIKWKTSRHCVLVMDNGTVVTLTVASHSGDLERIMIDRSLVSKMEGSLVTNALFVHNGLILTFGKDQKPLWVTVGNRGPHSAPISLTLSRSDSGRRLEKISDSKIIGIKGLSNAVSDYHLGTNSQNDLVVFWSVHARERTAGNIVIFRLQEIKLEMSCEISTQHDPVDVSFSKTRRDILYVLERVSSTTYQTTVYEHGNKTLKEVYTEPEITCKATITALGRNNEEAKLLLGCEDGSILIHDNSLDKDSLVSVKAYFSPISKVQWHPAGTFAFVASPYGQFQCFDTSLNPLYFLLASEDPLPTSILEVGSCFMAQGQLKDVGWASEPSVSQESSEDHGGFDNFLMVFETGPLVLLRLDLGLLSRGKMGSPELVCEYIRMNCVDQAVSLLSGLNWSSQSSDCFACMTLIVDHLLVQPLNAHNERQLEEALDSFLAPSRPLCRQVKKTYKVHIKNLARRFFQLLLRYRRLDRALRLAEKIKAKDLFMDLHFAALECSEKDLAHKAKQLASDLLVANPLIDSLQTVLSLDDEEVSGSAVSLKDGALPSAGSQEKKGKKQHVKAVPSSPQLVPLQDTKSIQFSSDESSCTEYSDSEPNQLQQEIPQ